VVKIEDMLRASGIDKVSVVNPFNLAESKEAFKDAIQHDGPSGVVLRGTCALVARRNRLTRPPRYVDPEICTGCLLCVSTLSCPAMEIKDGKMSINSDTCEGCGLCAQVCPFQAIQGGDQ